MHEEISNEIRKIIKTKISGSDCENRWKVLERNYKKFLDNSKLIGRGRKVFEDADVKRIILDQKKNISILNYFCHQKQLTFQKHQGKKQRKC